MITALAPQRAPFHSKCSSVPADRRSQPDPLPAALRRGLSRSRRRFLKRGAVPRTGLRFRMEQALLTLATLGPPLAGLSLCVQELIA